MSRRMLLPILAMSHQKCGRRVMRVNSPLVTRHTAATSTGAGMSSGGLLNAAVRSSMPSLSLGNNLQDTVSAAGRNDIGTTRQSTRMTSQGLSEAWSSAFQGSILKTLP